MPQRLRQLAPTWTSFLIDKILDLVGEVCTPASSVWREDLGQRLNEILYRRFTDGHRLTPDDLNAILWGLEGVEDRIRTLEARLERPPPPNPGEVEVTNGDERMPSQPARDQGVRRVLSRKPSDEESFS